MLTMSVVKAMNARYVGKTQRRLSASFIIGAMTIPNQSRMSPTTVAVGCLNSLRAIMSRDGDRARLKTSTFYTLTTKTFSKYAGVQNVRTQK